MKPMNDMKPMIILPPDTMSAEDIKKMDENGICVVVSNDPSKVKFVDPLPAKSSRTEIEAAAIRMSRILLNGQWGDISNSSLIGLSEFARLYVRCLINGTPLDKNGPAEETLEKNRQLDYSEAYRLEVQKIAREDARAERQKKKEAEAAAKAKSTEKKSDAK